MKDWIKLFIILVVIAAGLRLAVAVWNWSDDKVVRQTMSLARAAPIDRPYIDIAAEARTKLLQKVKGVQIGDPVERVLELLGGPEDDIPAPTTQAADAEPIPMYVGSKLVTYYIRKKAKNDFNEEFDEHVHIFLDGYECVEHIYIKTREFKHTLSRSGTFSGEANDPLNPLLKKK
jgi:hypothetical protein